MLNGLCTPCLFCCCKGRSSCGVKHEYGSINCAYFSTRIKIQKHSSINSIANFRLPQIPASYRPPTQRKCVCADCQSYQSVSRETVLSDWAAKPDNRTLLRRRGFR